MAKKIYGNEQCYILSTTGRIFCTFLWFVLLIVYWSLIVNMKWMNYKKSSSVKLTTRVFFDQLRYFVIGNFLVLFKKRIPE